MYYRIITVLLAVSLFVCNLSACSSPNSADTVSNTSSSVMSTIPEAESSEIIEPDESSVDEPEIDRTQLSIEETYTAWERYLTEYLESHLDDNIIAERVYHAMELRVSKKIEDIQTNDGQSGIMAFGTYQDNSKRYCETYFEITGIETSDCINSIKISNNNQEVLFSSAFIWDLTREAFTRPDAPILLVVNTNDGELSIKKMNALYEIFKEANENDLTVTFEFLLEDNNSVSFDMSKEQINACYHITVASQEILTYY